MTSLLACFRVVALAVLLLSPCAATPATAAPEGTLTWGLHVTLVSKWLDPADTEAFINPFMVLYAIHDALVKPMPGSDNTPSLAESWTASKDGLSYEFVLRKNAKFHNGDPVTAEDVKFSFDRYKGAGATLLKEKVKDLQVLAPNRVRFVLKEPWPDFMTFYGTSATGAAWIVPKKYVEKVGDDGFKKAPVGAGPYRFVSFTPGVELVMEAFEGYWRKAPAVKRMVFRSMADETTRAAALKAGDVDIVYLLSGPTAEEIKRTSGLRLAAAKPPGVVFLDLPEQWDPKSPWHDRRVRLAAGLAVNRQGYNQAELLGLARITGSIIPSGFDFYWPPPAPVYDPARARALLAEAGYPNGFDAGDFFCDLAFTGPEAVVNDLRAVGLGLKLRPLERAAFMKAFAERKFKNLMYASSAVFGNAATRIESFVVSGGMYVYGSYPDIDGLFREQVSELDRKRREAALHRIQQLVHDKAMFAPLWEPAILIGVGPSVEDAGLGLIAGYPYSAPYEDVRLKGK